MAVAEFNGALAKELGKQLKRELGVEHVRLNYKGTGSRAYRRQLFVRTANGDGVDLWLEGDGVRIGGVIGAPAGVERVVTYGTRTPAEVAAVVVGRLRGWATGAAAA